MRKESFFLIATIFIFSFASFGSAVAADEQTTTVNPENISLNYSDTSSMDSLINSSFNQTTPSQQSSGFEGLANTVNIKGFWINNGPTVLNNMNITALKNAGITDLFISTSKQDPVGSLVPFLDYFSGSGIKIHAWVSCFKYQNGSWINPVLNPTDIDQLVNNITTIATNYNVDGIHLDCARYPGTAYLYPNSTQNVTSFVQRIYDNIQNINNQQIPGKNQILLSAALMPEKSVNGYYYGQDYGQLAPYLDFLVPMIYKGNYAADTAWIGSTTQYIVQHAGGKPVLTGLQTYRSDSYPVPISACELNSDITAALDNGSSGYVLFKYGLTDMPGIAFYKTVTVAQIKTAATTVKNCIENNHQLPTNVTVGTTQVNMSTFLYLLSSSLININNGITSSTNLRDFKGPISPSGTTPIGNILKNEYLSMALTVKNFMETNGKAPNYTNSSLGNIRYESLIQMFSGILDYHALNNLLPADVSVNPWSPPYIISTDPSSNATNVSTNSPIITTFNENIIAGTNYSGIYLKNTITGIIASITKSISNNILTIQSTDRNYNTQYTVYIPAGAVKDLDNNDLISAYTYNFTTLVETDTTPPTVINTDPTNNAVNVSPDKVIQFTFSENVKAGSNFWIELKNSNGTIIPINKTISSNVLTITPTSALTESRYSLSLHTGSITDLAGNLLALCGINFTVGTSPTITETDPTNDAVNIPANKVIKVTFNEAIKAGSNFWIELKTNDGTIIPISKSITDNILAITPTNILTQGTYNLTLHAGCITDMVGNPLNLYTSNFTVDASPSITNTSPANNATHISLTTPITITFNENITAGANYSGIYVKNTVSGAIVSITKSISGKILTIIQTSSRLYNTTYQIYIPAGAVKDATGNNLATAYSSNFTTTPPTTDTTPPTLTSTSPTSNAIGVSLTSPVIITFSENIAAGTNYSGIYLKNTASGVLVSITKSITGNILTIQQTTSRAYNKLYQVYIPAGAVKDAAGNNLASIYTYTFTTLGTDTIPPTITKTVPTNNATGVSLTSPITITFSENITAGTTYSGIYIKNLTSGKTVSIASKTISGKTLTIKMTSSRLSKNTYQVYMPAGAVKDLAGNALTASYSYQFKTI